MTGVIEFLISFITIGFLSIIAMFVLVIISGLVRAFIEITFERIKQRFFK